MRIYGLNVYAQRPYGMLGYDGMLEVIIRHAMCAIPYGCMRMANVETWVNRVFLLTQEGIGMSGNQRTLHTHARSLLVRGLFVFP